MITEALRHCRGIGPVRLAQLHARGVRSWEQILAHPERVPARLRGTLLEESRDLLAALAREDIRYFVDRFSPQDRWRILAHYFERATFFDIETTGLEVDAGITVIACWHRGALHSFVEHENLDEFLDLLDDVGLLVSFNGSTFDVPRVLDAFHIGALPCAHVDLRWPCFHRGLRGSLKDVTHQAGICRPADLESMGGELAVLLWDEWRRRGDASARQQLLRYCAADVLLLVGLSHHLTDRVEAIDTTLWEHLPAAGALGPGPVVSPFRSDLSPDTRASRAPDFGPAGLTRLRVARRSPGRPEPTSKAGRTPDRLVF